MGGVLHVPAELRHGVVHEVQAFRVHAIMHTGPCKRQRFVPTGCCSPMPHARLCRPNHAVRAPDIWPRRWKRSPPSPSSMAMYTSTDRLTSLPPMRRHCGGTQHEAAAGGHGTTALRGQSLPSQAGAAPHVLMPAQPTQPGSRRTCPVADGRTNASRMPIRLGWRLQAADVEQP